MLLVNNPPSKEPIPGGCTKFPEAKSTAYVFPTMSVVNAEPNSEVENATSTGSAELQYVNDAVYAVAAEGLGKDERSVKFKEVKTEWIESLTEEETEKYDSKLIGIYYHDVEKEAVRALVLTERKRLDGRATTEIRPIWCEVDYLYSPHGSAVFTRGETQSLTTVTLGSATDVNRLDGVTHQGHEDFYLHYNFPPFSTGEARMKFNVSRREIGHGNLAQRALKKMIPAENPYTVGLFLIF